MSFDLTQQPWIPANGPNGRETFSLREVLTRASDIHVLTVSPTTRVAILRQVLLPVILDAEGPPTSEAEWGERFRRGRFDAERIDTYLDTYADRFDLFHPDQPFAQVAGLTATSGEVKTAGLLVPSRASGNNVPLYSASTEASPCTLSPAEAVRWLLHAQCFDTAAIKSGAVGDPQVKGGKTTGNPTGPVGRFGVVAPTGANLFETLMLNLPIRPAGPDLDDRPWWDRPALTAEWTTREASGILDLLTWQSRRIRLIPSTDDTGSTVVTSIVLCAGDRLSVFPEFEPHTTWNVDAKPKPGMPAHRPRTHQSGRSAWRGLEALLAIPPADGAPTKVRTSHLLRQVADLQGRAELPETFPLGVEVVGVEYGNQSAVIENLIHDQIPLPVVALQRDHATRAAVERFATDADELSKLMDRLEGDIMRSLGGDLVPWDKGQRASARLIHLLDQPVRRILAALRDAPDRYEDAVDLWSQIATSLTWRVAEEVLADAPPASHRGRDDANEHHHNLPIAELRFRSGLRKLLGVLPDLHPATDHEATA